MIYMKCVKINNYFFTELKNIYTYIVYIKNGYYINKYK